MATGWHSAQGDFIPTSRIYTIEHNLGVIPDIFIIIKDTQLPITSSSRIYILTGFSDRLYNMLLDNDGYVRGGYSSLAGYNNTDNTIDILTISANNIELSEGYFGVLRNCTENTIIAGADVENAGLVVNESYTWTAMWCDGELYGDGSVPTPMMLTSSANRGGYQVVDLKNTDFTPETAVKISNVYNLVNSNSKAVLLSGIVINGETYNDLFISLYKVDYKYTAKVYDYYIVIDDENNVTFTSNELTTTNNYIEEDDL